MVIVIPTYHIVPRVPPPPLGPLKLGTIIDSLEDLNPLNLGNELQVDKSRIFKFHEEDFEITREEILKGTGGVGIKIASLPGIGADVSAGGETTIHDTYKFAALDTEYFPAGIDDYQTAAGNSRVQQHLKYSGFAPVYMITGMKIGHNPQVTITRNGKVQGTFSIGVDTGGVTLGPHSDLSKETKISQGSKSSPDSIVFGIRVRKLLYKKRYIVAGQRSLHNEAYNSKAELVGVTGPGDEVAPEFDVTVAELDEELKGAVKEEKDDKHEGRIAFLR
jgi:hypothetical protein